MNYKNRKRIKTKGHASFQFSQPTTNSEDKPHIFVRRSGPSLPHASDFLSSFCSGLDFSSDYRLGTFVCSFPPWLPVPLAPKRGHSPHGSFQASSHLVTLRQKRLFRGRSAGVTLPLQRHSPGKRTPLLPQPPPTACLCQEAGALGHSWSLSAHSLHPESLRCPSAPSLRRQPAAAGSPAPQGA